MKFHPIVNEDDGQPDGIRAFAQLINLANSVSITGNISQSDHDDIDAISDYQADLQSACNRAKVVFIRNPSLETIMWHSLQLQGYMTQLIGAAPMATKEITLLLKAIMLIICDQYFADRIIDSGK
jgi:hypothetical protein